MPAYITGALYILETGPENKDELYRYIANDYVYRYDSQQASCRGNLTLLYIRKMFDKSEYRGKPFGREEKLDVANQGKGLCSGALAFAGTASSDEDYAQELAACRTLPLTTLVGAYFALSQRPGKESATSVS